MSRTRRSPGLTAFLRRLDATRRTRSGRPAHLILIDLGQRTDDGAAARVHGALAESRDVDAVWTRDADRQIAILATLADADARRFAERLLAAARPDRRGRRRAVIVDPVSQESGLEVLRVAEAALRGNHADTGPPIAAAAALRAERRRGHFRALISAVDSIDFALQPIAHLDAPGVHGFEALARFTTTPTRGPDRVIAEAARLGLGVELELECLRRAWRRVEGLPVGARLALNASPDALVSEAVEEAFGEGPLDRLVIEVTEHEKVTNYSRLANRLAILRGRGAAVAIDDTGAGYASLSHLVELRPDYVKLDRGLVQGLDSDAERHALVSNMLRLADELGATMIAEGVETAAELEALRRLGVPMAQGYLIGRPRMAAAQAPERS